MGLEQRINVININVINSLITSMIEITKAVVSGVLILVAGQFLQKSILEPIQEFRKLIGEILASLTFYANLNSNTESSYFFMLQELKKSEDISTELAIERVDYLIHENWKRCDEAQFSLRQQASQLRGRANVIMGFKFFAALGILPKYEVVKLVTQELIGLSNSMHANNEGSAERILKIKQSLEMIRF